MKCNIEIKDGRFSMSMEDLLVLIHDATEDEYDAERLIEDLGWIKQIRAKVIDILKHEYSSTTMSRTLHAEREDLLDLMGERTIQYHANKIADMIEDKERWRRDYWKLYHAINYPESCGISVPQTNNINFVCRRELENILEKHLRGLQTKEASK